MAVAFQGSRASYGEGVSTLTSNHTERWAAGGLVPPRNSREDNFGGDDASSRLILRYRLGLGLWVCSIVMLFVGLSSAYVVRRGIPAYDAASGAYSIVWETVHLPLALLFGNALILVAASLTIEVARRVARKHISGFPQKDEHPPQIWSVLSLVLLAGFVTGQALVWKQLRAQGELLATGARIAFFYVLSGTHAAHAIAGVFLLAWVVVLGRVHRPALQRYVTTDLTAWYLHSMTVLWICLLAFLLTA